MRSYTCYCNCRVFTTWTIISIIASLIYALILFFTLNQKDIRAEEAPLTLPFINAPNNYKIFLSFDLENNKANSNFEGVVNITFQPTEETQRLYLHRGSNIKINKYSLNGENGSIKVDKGPYNEQSEIQTFVPSSNFTLPANYTFTINFSGTTNDFVKLFTYTTQDNEMRYGIVMAHSRSATKGLRYLVPSFDARDYPSLFDITIRRRRSLRALTNFQRTESTENFSTVGYTDDSFTPKRLLKPSQLVVVICDFPEEQERSSDITISTFYRKAIVESVNIQRLRQFMDVTSYEIGKLDAIVIPEQPTVHQPGIAIVNEKEAIAENAALAFLNQQGL